MKNKPRPTKKRPDRALFYGKGSYKVQNSAALQAGSKSSPLWTKDFIFISLTNLTMFLGLQLLLPTMPVFVDRLGGKDIHVGLVMGIFTVSAMLIRPWAGYKLDTRGRRGILLGGLVLFIASVITYNWAAGIIVLLLTRFLHGLGWGACTTAAGTVAADIIPRPRMGEGMGYFGLATAVSMAAAPAAGIFLINHYSFAHLFYTSAFLALLALGFASGIRYQKVEQQSNDSRPALFEKSALRPSLVIFFVTTTFGSIVSFLVLYAAQRGIENIGPFFTVFALIMLVSRPVSGLLVDRKGYDIVVIPGILLLVAAMLILAASHSLWMFLSAGACYGLGFGSVQPSMQALAVRNTEPNRRGAVNSTFFSAFDLGIGGGAMLWGLLVQVTGYSLMYAIASISGIIALIIYIIMGRN